ncbi:cation diffusion facilitator family transporter [Marinobacter sp. es.048]|uniref:cation diffusion facilitator family transporter n=1 Tax=Marinobacter sp. es.048 TaxID=1761795 RepID=UPI000B5974E9|nr:cation diffusion facilitator family transporter [Marinobacter sp. es.048]SNC66431.1 cation diffusion facilitator family transporter [Marinobacter sp. es.048]
MQQVFEAKTHAHSLREPDALRDCTPTDVVGSTPREAVQVTLLGMAVDVLLGAAKIVAGSVSGSHALVADGVHSFSDAVTDIMVIIMMRYSRQPPDNDHPYGHERFETLGTVMMGCLLVAVSLRLALDNIRAWLEGSSAIETGWLAVTIAILSIASKEWLFRYTKRVGEQIRSELIVSNAWHSRTDAISSAIVLIAIVGASAGLEWLDFVAAIAVAAAIGKIGLGMALDNIKELVDTAIAPDKRSRLLTLMEQHPMLDNVHSLRSRRMGKKYLVECVVDLPGHLTIQEGSGVIEEVRAKVMSVFPEIREFSLRVEVSPTR